MYSTVSSSVYLAMVENTFVNISVSVVGGFVLVFGGDFVFGGVFVFGADLDFGGDACFLCLLFLLCAYVIV